MGQFSVEKPVLPGSALSGNQQPDRTATSGLARSTAIGGNMPLKIRLLAPMYEAKWTTMAKRHLLFVDDNFHFMDEGERIGPIEFDTSDAALAEARRIVDADLAGYFKPGMTVAEMYDYT